MKKLLILILIYPCIGFAQNNKTQDVLLKKFCVLINIERHRNEIVNILLFNSFSPLLSLSEYESRVDKLFNEKTALNTFIYNYFKYGNEITLVQLDHLGFSQEEAIKMASIIETRSYMDEKEKAMLIQQKSKKEILKDSIESIRKKAYNLSNIDSTLFKNLRLELVKNLADNILKIHKPIYQNKSSCEEIDNKYYFSINKLIGNQTNYISSNFNNKYINPDFTKSLKPFFVKTLDTLIEVSYEARYNYIPISFIYGSESVIKKGITIKPLLRDRTLNPKLLKDLQNKMKDFKNGKYSISFLIGHVDNVVINEYSFFKYEWSSWEPYNN